MMVFSFIWLILLYKVVDVRGVISYFNNGNYKSGNTGLFYYENKGRINI